MVQNIVLLGYGTIGKCVFDLLTLDAPFIYRKTGLDFKSIKIHIVDMLLPKPFETNGAIVNLIQTKLKTKDFTSLLRKIDVRPMDLVIDLTSCTGTRDIIKKVAVDFQACYICTAIEGWNGWMFPMPQMVSHVATLKKHLPNGSPTVLITHGMNPGMVSHFALLALDIIGAKESKNIKTLYITETDTQVRKKNGRKKSAPLPVAVPHLTVTRPNMPKRIISTWGPQNFVDEMNALPTHVLAGKVAKGKRRAYKTTIESLIFSPQENDLVRFNGHIVTHEESFTLNNFLKHNYGTKADIAFVYKPTEPSLKSFLAKGTACRRGERKGLLLKGSDVRGYDTVGIYMELFNGKSVWVGNSCEAGFAVNDSIRKKHHNATTMQVAAGVISGIYALCKAPNMGFCFPEEIPRNLRNDLLQFSERYYGKITIITNL